MKWDRVLWIGIVMAFGVSYATAGAVYVSSFESDSVLKFDADSGAPLGVFVAAGSGGLNGPTGLTFGPDGHLYVSSFTFNNNVLKFHGKSGRFLGIFVGDSSGACKARRISDLDRMGSCM